MSGYYDFDGEPITMEEWAQLFEERCVGESLVRWQVGDDHIGDARVSTVWMGLDHRFMGDGPPLIFESMVFGGALDGEMDRYSTKEKAAAGHARLVALVRAEQAVTS